MSTDLLFAVLPIIVHPRISYLPFFQSSCTHGSPIYCSSKQRASMALLFTVLPSIVRPWLSYLPFFQSSCTHGSPICRSSNHCAPMYILFAVLPIIVHPWICYLPFLQPSCICGPPICSQPFFQSLNATKLSTASVSFYKNMAFDRFVFLRKSPMSGFPLLPVTLRGH